MYLILGGGISGLSAAWYLRKKTEDKIILLENEARPGGWIESSCRRGFFFEKGPRSLRSQGGEDTWNLIESLGMTDRVLPGDRAAQQRYLYIDQSLRKLPGSLKNVVSSPWIWAAAWPLISEGLKKTFLQDDETIYDFFSRRLSPRFAETFIDPMVSGIYAGDIHQLSIKSCFPKIYQYERSHGSIMKGMLARKKRFNPPIQRSIYTFQNGLQELVDQLVKQLDIEIKLSTPAAALHFGDAIRVDSLHESFQATHVISALPSRSLSRLLHPHDPLCAQILDDIPMASLAVVNLGFHDRVLDREGFGYLIPSSEREEILGVVWDFSTFPSQNQHPRQTRLTVMIGGARMTDFDSYSESDFLSMSLKALKKHLKISVPPDYTEVSFARHAIPQYTVGHSLRVKEIETKIHRLSPNFHFTGHSFYGVSINDCIQNSKRLIERLFPLSFA